MQEEEAVSHVTNVPHYAKQQEILDQIEEPQEDDDDDEGEEEDEIDESGLNDLADVVINETEQLNIDEDIEEESEESDVGSDVRYFFNIIFVFANLNFQYIG
jgi:hypothetical protein